MREFAVKLEQLIIQRRMKKSFIVYEPPYGGQSFKIRNPIKALEAFNNFLTELTNSNKIPKIELKVFESPAGQQSYQSDKIVEKATELFPSGQRRQWAGGVREEYMWFWRLDYNELGKAIQFMIDSLKGQKYFIGPVQLTLSYDFKWINPLTKKEYPFPEDEYWYHRMVSENSVLLFLSTTNSIIPNLHFPFQEVNYEFLALKNKIDKLLPADLKEKNYRLWIPQKKEGYTRRKIDEKAWIMPKMM